MKSHRKMFVMLLVVSLLGVPPSPTSNAIGRTVTRADELIDRALVIKPNAKELSWLTIPWVLDLKAAQETAKAEGRPIFLWVTGDDPLERC